MPSYTGTMTSSQGARTLDITTRDVITFTPTAGTYTVEYPLGTVLINASSSAQSITSNGTATQLRVVCLTGSLAFSNVDNADSAALSQAESAAAQALVSGAWNLPRVADRLLVAGDSREARSSVPFTALGGWVKTITAISVGNPDGSALVTFSAAHNVPVGQRVLFDPDAPINAALRNRWFDFTSVTSTTGTISVPSDAYDRAYLVAAIAATVGYSGSSTSLTIDAVQGIAASISEFCATLTQPWNEVVNLCVPGALTADTLALLRTVDLKQFTHVRLVVGINDMAQGVAPATSLTNALAILDLCTTAGVVCIVSDEYPQGSMDATKQAWLRTFNAGLRAAAAARGNALLVPAYSIVNDPATDTGSSVDLTDGTHYSAAGAEKIGRAAATVAAPFIKRVAQLVAPVSSINYVTNGNMSGTTGTHTTGGAGAGQSQGQVATGWVVSTPGTNVTCTARKVSGVPRLWRPGTVYALGDVVIPSYETGLHYHCTTAGTAGASPPVWGVVPWATTSDNTVVWTAAQPLSNLSSRADWQYLQGVVGATVGAQERITLQQTVTLATVGLAAGDYVRGQMRVHGFDSNWRNVMLAIRSGATIDGLFAFAADGAKNSFILPAGQPFNRREGVLRTPWWKIPTGQTTLTFYAEGGLGTGSENSTIRLLMSEAKIEKRV